MNVKRVLQSLVAPLVCASSLACLHLPRDSGAPNTSTFDAETTVEGRVIVFQWTAGGEKRRALLGGGYGLVVFYEADSVKPVPQFSLFVEETAQVVRASGLERFKDALRRLPAGATLHYYNTCGPGTHSGLDPAVLEEVREACAGRGITFQRGDAEVFMICKCL